jgi:hypothetical protein
MKTLAFAAALLVSSFQATPAPDPGTIYGNALANGWENWKWDGAETELSVEIGGTARKPIRVEAQGYKGLYLHHTGFDTKPYKSLSFMVQSTNGTGQIRVMAIVGGKPVPEKQKAVKLAPGGWTKVDVPLVDLGAAGTTIDGIWFQNDSADPSPRFYLTDILFH